MAKDTDWPNKEKASEITGLSVRTLERLIAGKQVRHKYVRVPMRRPMCVLNPEDLSRIKAQMEANPEDAVAAIRMPIRPEEEPKPTISFEVAHLMNRDREPATTAVAAPVALPPVVDLLRSLLEHVQPRQWPLFLTLEQASAYTGLPVGTLTRYLSDGILSGVWAKGWRLRRTDLDAL